MHIRDTRRCVKNIFHKSSWSWISTIGYIALHWLNESCIATYMITTKYDIIILCLSLKWYMQYDIVLDMTPNGIMSNIP